MKEKQKVWDTLGQPSGKFDYMVKYSKQSTNNNHIPISGTVSTGWKKKDMEGHVQSLNREPFKGRSHWSYWTGLQSQPNFTNRRFSPYFTPKRSYRPRRRREKRRSLPRFQRRQPRFILPPPMQSNQ